MTPLGRRHDGPAMSVAAPQPDWRLIYIAGRGHSGTTFLDVLLGNAASTESVGEVISGLARGSSEACSCGVTVGECDFWMRVRNSYREKWRRDLFTDASWLLSRSDVRRLPSAWLSRIEPGAEWGEYVSLNESLFSTLASVTAKPVLVDSNKELTRALMILRGHPTSKVIHLHRDPLSVLGSYYYRQTKGMPLKFLRREFYPKLARFPALMIIGVAWTVGMLLAALIALRFPRRVLQVSYERLCEDPNAELRRIAAFVGLDLEPVIEGIARGKPFPVGHNVGGNELRHEGYFTFIPNARGRRALPLPYRMFGRLVTAPGVAARAFLSRTRSKQNRNEEHLPVADQ